MMITSEMIKELRMLTGAGMLDCKKALTMAAGDLDEALKWLREQGISKANQRAERIAAEGLTNILVKGNKAIIVEVNAETDFVAKNKEFQDLVNLISSVLIEHDVETVEAALQLKGPAGTLEELIISKTLKIGEKLSLRRFSYLDKTDEEVFGSYIHLGGKISSLVKVEGVGEEVARDIAMHIAAMNPLYLNRAEIPEDVLEKEKALIKEAALNEGKPAAIAEKMVIGRLNKYYQDVCLEEQAFIKDDQVKVVNYVKQYGGKISAMLRYEVGVGLEKKTEVD